MVTTSTLHQILHSGEPWQFTLCSTAFLPLTLLEYRMSAHERSVSDFIVDIKHLAALLTSFSGSACVRALVKQLFKPTKQTVMQNYLRAMKHNVPTLQIYGKLRQMRWRPPRKLFIQRKFSNVLRDLLPQFLATMVAQGNLRGPVESVRIKLDFTGLADEQYKVQFTPHELHAALSSAENTSRGSDWIHYSMLKQHAPVERVAV